MILDLRGQPLLSIQRAVPNPVGAGSGNKATFGARSMVAASLNLVLYDAKGTAVRTISKQLQANAPVVVSIDCTGLPSGSYYYIATATTLQGSGQVRGALEIIR
jgi:hypothetical protein